MILKVCLSNKDASVHLDTSRREALSPDPDPDQNPDLGLEEAARLQAGVPGRDRTADPPDSLQTSGEQVGAGQLPLRTL